MQPYGVTLSTLQAINGRCLKCGYRAGVHLWFWETSTSNLRSCRFVVGLGLSDYKSGLTFHIAFDFFSLRDL
jgi:hypothetical protein